MKGKRLYKSDQRVISGALGGIAEYFNLEPALVRIIYTIVSLFSMGFPGITLYIILMLVIPERPQGGAPTDDQQPTQTEDNDWSDF